MNTIRLAAALCTLYTLAACNTPEVTFNAPPSVDSSDSSVSSDSTIAPVSSTTLGETGRSMPASVLLTMDFASQAPTGNWDPPFDEACEEASLIIVHHYLQEASLSAASMERDILEMVAYEESVGLPIDIDMHQLKDVTEAMYTYSAEVIEGAEVTIERIKQEIASGYPVIVPLAGQDIGNPYYSEDGPPYHVLVIVGYNEKEFITHDVGTKRGKNYAYPQQTIMNAIHDWNGSVETIRSGPKRMLIVRR